jgi:dihydroorotase
MEGSSMAAYNHRILIKNGHIYDPGQGSDRIGDLAMFKNRIVDQLPDDGTNLMIIDAEGDLVLPGLIDFHTHVGFGVSEIAIDTDAAFLPNGVTATVDAGTRGIANIHQMAAEVVPTTTTTIKCLLNLSATGIVTGKYGECIDPKYFDLEQIRFCFEKYSHVLIGLKLRLMKDTLPDFEQTGLAPLIAALEIAERLGVFLAVHITNPPCPYKDMVNLLRPGDILVHPFQGSGTTIMDENGNIDPCLHDAKKRGVIFDLAGGRTNQSYAVAKKAIANGLVPDVFSTDLVRDSVYMKPVFSLPYILSTYRNLGVPLADLIRGCTTLPAKLMGMEGKIGTLKTGAIADICIMKEKSVKLDFNDWYGNSFVGETILEPRVTIKDGRVVFMNMEVKQEVVRPREIH